MSQKPTVLFVCVHNAGRSQMAAGFMRELGQGRVEVLLQAVLQRIQSTLLRWRQWLNLELISQTMFRRF